MEFIKKNFRHVLMSITLFFFILMLGLGLGLSAFGMGMESQRFINSVEKTIDQYIPKSKVVIDGDGLLYDFAVSQLKKSYVTDVVSTLTDEQKNDVATEKFWETYANNKFDQRWKSVIDNKEDIDINQFSHELVAFDIEIAKEFHNYGFTHSGLSWIGKSGVLSQLWSSDYAKTEIYQEAQQNQTIINQSEYQSGVYLVNNKVWFINDQIKTLTESIQFDIVFKDNESVKKILLTTDENGNEIPVQVSINNFYHPNFTNGFEQTRIGAIFLIILTPIFGVVFIGVNFFNYYLKNLLVKNKLIKDNLNSVIQTETVVTE